MLSGGKVPMAALELAEIEPTIGWSPVYEDSDLTGAEQYRANSSEKANDGEANPMDFNFLFPTDFVPLATSLLLIQISFLWRREKLIRPMG